MVYPTADPGDNDSVGVLDLALADTVCWQHAEYLRQTLPFIGFGVLLQGTCTLSFFCWVSLLTLHPGGACAGRPIIISTLHTIV